MSDDLQRVDASREHPPPSQKREREVLTLSASWRAPLPPPDHLQAYDKVFPGCAERIVSMAEAESEHRRSHERFQSESDRLLIKGEIGSETRGMYLGFVLALLVIGMSGFLIYIGRLAWGVGLVSLELISLVALFVYGRHRFKTAFEDRPDQDAAQTYLPRPE